MKIFFNTCLALWIIFLGNCTGCKSECPENVTVELPSFFVPQKASYHLGDTVTLSVEIPDKLYGKEGGFEVEFVDYDFQLDIGVEKIDTAYPESNSVRFIRPVEFLHGEASAAWARYENSFGVHTEYTDHVYRFTGKFVLLEKGLFAFSFGPPQWVDFFGQGACGSILVNIRGKMNDRGDNNFELLQLSPVSVYQQYKKENFDEYGGYCLLVE